MAPADIVFWVDAPTAVFFNKPDLAAFPAEHRAVILKGLRHAKATFGTRACRKARYQWPHTVWTLSVTWPPVGGAFAVDVFCARCAVEA